MGPASLRGPGPGGKENFKKYMQTKSLLVLKLVTDFKSNENVGITASLVTIIVCE